jgi:hypothetical protein
MKPRLIITIMIVAGSISGAAAKPKRNAIIDAANRLESEANQTSEKPVAESPPEERESPTAEDRPVELKSAPIPDSSEATTPEEPPQKEPESGVAVTVEKMSTGAGSIDPGQVKLLAPYPAKPLAPPPTGWRLDTSETATPFTREIEISSGSKITLTIRPHLLVPDADGAQVFNIAEPGYEAALGYQQISTVGAILSNSIQQLDEDSKHLGQSIDRLQQLLISLPKSENESKSVPVAKPVIIRNR